jgi:hypothetical protein
MMIHHYLLTRFNLSLWQKDKTGHAVGCETWLKKRMSLFETYCLPSVMGQTCQNFCWILLADEETPAFYREKMMSYRSVCPQIHFVGVKSEYAFRFAVIFQNAVMADLRKKGWNEGDLCLTTYLDNDDCISRTFVERAQKECLDFRLQSAEKQFLSFDYGLQLFTDMNHFATRIFYPNNHFLTLAECVSADKIPAVRTCYGYGSHFLLEKRGLSEVYHIKDKEHPMWIEVIHDGNVDNDVKMTFDTHIVDDKDLLRREFSLPIDVGYDNRLTFVCRVLTQMWRRLRNKLADR